MTVFQVFAVFVIAFLAAAAGYWILGPVALAFHEVITKGIHAAVDLSYMLSEFTGMPAWVFFLSIISLCYDAIMKGVKK